MEDDFTCRASSQSPCDFSQDHGMSHKYILIDNDRYKLIMAFRAGVKRCDRCHRETPIGLYKRYNRSIRICGVCINNSSNIYALKQEQTEKLNKTIIKQMDNMDNWILRFTYSSENAAREMPLILKHNLEPEVWLRFANNKFIVRMFDIKQECIDCHKVIDVDCNLYCEGNRRCDKCNKAVQHKCSCTDILRVFERAKRNSKKRR